MEFNLGPGKMFSRINFFELCLIPGGKYRIAMTRFLLERGNFVRSYLLK